MTDRASAFDAMAAASAAMLTEHHPADVLTCLLIDCIGPLSVDAAAILVVESGGGLGLLAATAHRAEEIEMLQTQQLRGPCVDAVQSGEEVAAVGDALVERWGPVGSSIREAGFESVHAFPLRWHGRVLGGLNIFRVADDLGRWPDTLAIGQAFADVAALVLVQVDDVSADHIAERVRRTMGARSVIEQAKGVLAHLRGIEPDAAFEELLRRAGVEGASLVETAREVVRDQHT